MRIERNLKLIDAYTIGMNLNFILAVILPYYRDQMHIGFREFMIAESCFAAVVVLCDVPTGWISDVWQRKHAQALGFLFEIIGWSCILVGKNFFMAAMGQSIIGIGISLINGTNTAILYDTLMSAGREGEYRRREGRRWALCMYSLAGASIVGSLIYPHFHHLPAIISLVTLVGALIASCLLDEPERHRRRPEKHPIMDILLTIRYAVHGHAEIGFAILAAAALFSTTKIILWSQQPYYMLLQVPESWYGALMAGGFLLSGISGHMAHLLDGRISAGRALAIIWVVAVAICVSSGVAAGWHGVVLLMFGGSCLYGIAMPRVNEVINRNIDSSRRATVLSTQSTMVSLFFIPLSNIMGAVSKHWGIQAVLMGLAAWLVVAGVVLGVMAMSKRRAAIALAN